MLDILERSVAKADLQCEVRRPGAVAANSSAGGGDRLLRDRCIGTRFRRRQNSSERARIFLPSHQTFPGKQTAFATRLEAILGRLCLRQLRAEMDAWRNFLCRVQRFDLALSTGRLDPPGPILDIQWRSDGGSSGSPSPNQGQDPRGLTDTRGQLGSATGRNGSRQELRRDFEHD